MNVLADLKQFLQRARVFPESYKLKGCGNIIMPPARFGFLSDQPILVFLSGTTLAAAGSPLEACSVVLHLEADQPTVGERRWLRNGKKIKKDDFLSNHAVSDWALYEKYADAQEAHLRQVEAWDRLVRIQAGRDSAELVFNEGLRAVYAMLQQEGCSPEWSTGGL